MIKQIRENQNGNVLFLILIAVALFAALSYAVTQSTRSGSGNADKEQAGINAAQLTQYPTSVRTSVVRMVISGTSPSALEFNTPSGNYDGLTSPSVGVFHPSGGAATYSTAPASMMDSGNPGTWYFNASLAIQNVGTNAGNDYIAFLPGITSSLCSRINDDLGITGDTTLGGTPATIKAAYETLMDDSYTVPGVVHTIGDSDSEGLEGQAFGCFTNGAEYVYYHLLYET
jgi:hypothetical protein